MVGIGGHSSEMGRAASAYDGSLQIGFEVPRDSYGPIFSGCTLCVNRRHAHRVRGSGGDRTDTAVGDGGPPCAELETKSPALKIRQALYRKSSYLCPTSLCLQTHQSRKLDILLSVCLFPLPVFLEFSLS